MSAPESVRVPPELEPLFQQAEAYVRAYFAEHRTDPSRGIVEFHDERYIRIRAKSISIEFFELVRSVYRGHRDADEVARSMLFDVAHAIGMADARDFREQMGVTEPMEALSAGPVHFAYTGWAFVDLDPASRPTPDDDYLLIYDHPNSFEADAWLKDGRTPPSPICVMNAGYSSGWCEACFGIGLVAREIRCRAMGHEACRFVMAPPSRLSEQVQAFCEERYGADFVPPPAVPRFFEQLRRRDEELVHAQRMEAIGRLAGGIAHDFNNLLTVILGCAEQLEMALPAGSAERRNAEAIAGAAERAGSLTQQLLALTRKQALDLDVVDLGRLLIDLKPLLQGLLAERVELRMGEMPHAAVEAEGSALEQVVVNLAVNALEAMEHGGVLEITLVPVEGFWRLRVTDDGPGMSPELQSRAFEPFFSTKEGNSGLGLASVRGLVGQYGGAVNLESTPGEGTRVDVILPQSDKPVPIAESAPAVRKTNAEILVIEDDPAIRAMLRRTLPIHGYVVHLAASGPEALAMLDDLPPLDLILSDVVMPGMDGPAAVAAIQQRFPDIPALFMTGYAETELVPVDADVLRKPFTVEALHARLSAALEQSHPAFLT